MGDPASRRYGILIAFHAHFKFSNSGGRMSQKILMTSLGLCLIVLLNGCASKNDISNITEFKSKDQKKIYEKLEKSRKYYNERRDLQLSGFTENAQLMTRHNNEIKMVSPEELKEIWPERIKTFKKHQLKLNTIEVKNLNIENNIAQLTTKRTYYSRRWNEYYNYEFEKVYKKVDGEWKLHNLKFEEI
jgi:hypothetical protein